MGGLGDDSYLFLCSGRLTFVENSDSDPIVADGACINSLLILVDRAQVKRGEGSLGQIGPPPFPLLGRGGGGGGGGGWCASFCGAF